MARLRITPGRMQMLDDADFAVEDTDAPSLALAPAAALDFTGVNKLTVSFPNFNFSAPEYVYNSGGTGGGPPFQEECSTFSWLAAQSWGPSGEGYSPNLSNTLLGALPEGADGIDVDILSVNRTNAPDAVLQGTVLTMQRSDERISLGGGGDLPLELIATIRRMISFRAIEGSVYLTRKQSAAPVRIKQIDYKYTPFVSYLPPSPPFPHTVFWNLRQGDPGQCSLSGNPDLSSIFQIEAIITPRRYNG